MLGKGGLSGNYSTHTAGVNLEAPSDPTRTAGIPKPLHGPPTSAPAPSRAIHDQSVPVASLVALKGALDQCELLFKDAGCPFLLLRHVASWTPCILQVSWGRYEDR